MTVAPHSDEHGVHCSCGSGMTAERGRLFDDEHGESEWLWWRCDEQPEHITRALPLPVQMARSV